MTAKDIREFTDYLRQCTDNQVRGVYEKENEVGREDYAELARIEAQNRGIYLD